MNYCKVVAIMNITDYGLISNQLKELNIPGVTVSQVQGFGDYINEYNEFGFSENMKIEIYTSQAQAEEIATVLSKLANEITEGGGIIAIEPLAQLHNVRKLKPD